MRKIQKIYLPFKRIIDFFGSIIGIIFCFFLFWWWIIAINFFVTNGHPFFLQERYGKNKKKFKIIKFRSMKIDANPNLPPFDMGAEEHTLMETKFGRFLRKTSLDETPQLLNIFLGQMSFIGPRPGSTQNEEYLVTYREAYTPNAFDVKPGLGGLAQLNMNRSHNSKDKAYFDFMYAKQMSFILDAKLFFKTIFYLFMYHKQ